MKNWKSLMLIVVLVMAYSLGSRAQGCMEADSDDGVSVVGYIQPTYDNFFFEEDDNGNTKYKPNNFYFKRARVGVVGSIPYDVSYYVMGEFSPLAHDDGSAYLLDAFVTYAPFGNYAKFSMGQFKSPFGLELNTPCHALYTIRRSTVVNNLSTPFRDMGLMAMFSTDTLLPVKDMISAKVAVLNGTGLNQPEDNKSKDIAARLVFQPVEGLKIGGSFRTGLKGTIPSTGEQDKMTRFGGDIHVELKDLFADYDNLIFEAEYISGEDIGPITSSGGGCGGKATTADEEKYNRSGFFGQIMYMTPFYLQPIVKYESFDPDGAYYSYLGVQQNFIQNTITFGVNYFINEWTRVQLNYYYNAEESGDVEYPNDGISFQIQAKF